jgi:tRNA G18 (ribose-2'-O)-methylase SpoU
MSSSSFWKPFVTGAVVSVSTLLIVQQLTSKRTTIARKRAPPPPPRQPREQTAADDEQEDLMDSPNLDMRMIRKAEGAVQKRTSRLTVVVERCTNDHNYSAILRTLEALGIQNVYIIRPPAVRMEEEVTLTTMRGTKVTQGKDEMEARKMHHLYAQRATEWLTVRNFDTTQECLDALRETGHTIWATDLSQVASCLSKEDLPVQENSSSVLPPKLAIVFGTEAVGCTQEMLDGADLRVYLPMRGIADSLNLSVATALVVHHLFLLDPSMVGDMLEEERRELRSLWFPKLATQRLLGARDKKEYGKLKASIKSAEDIKRKKESGQRMHQEQLDKLAKLSSMHKQLEDLDAKKLAQAQEAVADLVDNPPAPLTDMRRADEHRTWHGSKNTRNKNGEAWANMPATTGYNTQEHESSADFFRSRIKENQDDA